ncbi:hypothetical protein ASPVEDRAFT_888491 [Aspergillus versicolor CBS 583.65]|uniref:Uncharacterized protein n=1 Tax=Aspergillus versicolor CBS 583.65 TaxID=1036611 RepID=A0A1L9PLY5_ASPVE|nr:uncharacterized protein ASPVEDRAFT_888491 [Aspergillus versicolor CBS 583.65]OJJ02482.1 hypothetical protein ASPVEDRAFT_888491 [Aspergillus versicolor CBS 583.65]
MASLCPPYFPTELATKLAKYLDAYTLLHVSKVCHSWRDVSLPLLDKVHLEDTLSAFGTAVDDANHDALIYFASRIQRNKRTGFPTGCLALTLACTTTCTTAVRILIPYTSMPPKHPGSKLDLDAWDKPLFEAMRQQDPGVLEVLLDNGAPRDKIYTCGLSLEDSVSLWGESPTPESPKAFLHAAVFRKFPAAVRYILNKVRDYPPTLDAVLNEAHHGDRPLCSAAARGYTDILRILLDYKAIVNTDRNARTTPLGNAAAAGREEIARILLDHGADTELCGKSGQTPLFSAAYNPILEKEHAGVVRLLLGRGAKTEAVDKHGDTPLLWAVKHGCEESVRMLLEHGANVNHQDKGGITPLMAATCSEENMPSIVQLLEDYNAELGPW